MFLGYFWGLWMLGTGCNKEDGDRHVRSELMFCFSDFSLCHIPVVSPAAWAGPWGAGLPCYREWLLLYLQGLRMTRVSRQDMVLQVFVNMLCEARVLLTVFGRLCECATGCTDEIMGVRVHVFFNIL